MLGIDASDKGLADAVRVSRGERWGGGAAGGDVWKVELVSFNRSMVEMRRNGVNIWGTFDCASFKTVPSRYVMLTITCQYQVTRAQ